MNIKLFCWIVEFKLRRRNNKQRLSFLVNKLAQELKAQGYEIKNDPCQCITIWGHESTTDIDLSEKRITLDPGLMK